MLLWLLILACSGSAPEGASQGPPPALVEVETARPGTLDQPWVLLGEVVALERAELGAGAAGPIRAVRAREGDPVRAGAVLVEVDAALASARRDMARAQADEGALERARAERDLKRLQDVRTGVLATAAIDEASTRVESLLARERALLATAAEAEATLSRHRVAAPFDGLVVARHVDPGDWVQVGQTVLEVLSTAGVEVRVEAPAALLGAVSRGGSAVLVGQGEVPAEIVGVVPALDPVARTVRLRLSPTGEAPWLLPGTTVDVRLDVRIEGGVVVSRDAVVQSAQGSRVVRVAEGLAETVAVQVLATSGDDTLLLAEGLVPGDRVVTRGNERLRPGQPLRVAGE